MVSEHAADIIADDPLKATGIWGGLVPLSYDDFAAQAKENGMEPIDWLETVLRTCPLIRVEAVR